ncbi:hypothetical protein EXIGLDRAFT_784286 [Exidia glandulosa HHB12029]|uniref:Uncharacterized protein n=1 Tax=Exidia glandulosa HHB12029 TaxID=1314781 RepID=A0A166MJY6_EXIGL|nr:hypothetical protein EXIGLDRAFT_784286 [Exidia glandulosa HHB12029]
MSADLRKNDFWRQLEVPFLVQDSLGSAIDAQPSDGPPTPLSAARTLRLFRSPLLSGTEAPSALESGGEESASSGARVRGKSDRECASRRSSSCAYDLPRLTRASERAWAAKVAFRASRPLVNTDGTAGFEGALDPRLDSTFTEAIRMDGRALARVAERRCQRALACKKSLCP